MNCCLLDLFSFSQLKNKIWRFNFSAEDEKWTENAAWGRGKISRINLLCRRDESHEIWIKNEKQEQERERNNIKNYIQLIISKARLSCEADSRKYLVQFFWWFRSASTFITQHSDFYECCVKFLRNVKHEILSRESNEKSANPSNVLGPHHSAHHRRE